MALVIRIEYQDLFVLIVFLGTFIYLNERILAALQRWWGFFARVVLFVLFCWGILCIIIVLMQFWDFNKFAEYVLSLVKYIIHTTVSLFVKEFIWPVIKKIYKEVQKI